MTTKNASSPAETGDWQSRELVDLAKLAKIPPAKLAPVLGILWPTYHDFDIKAEQSQRWFRAGAVAVYGLSSLAVAVAIGQLLFMPATHGVVAAEVVAMVLALVLLTLAHRRHWKAKWLTKRYTAEQLRMHMYLAVVPPEGATPPGHGSPVDPLKTLPFYSQLGATLPPKAENALQDARLADCAVDDVAALKIWLGAGWIGSQIKFHRGAAKRHRKASLITRWTTIGLFAITLVAATLHATGVGQSLTPDGHPQGTLVAHLIVFLSIALPAMASAFHAINDLLDHERIAVRSRGMEKILDRLATEVENAQTLDQIRDLARRTEQIIAMETFEWLAALSFRQPPHTPA